MTNNTLDRIEAGKLARTMGPARADNPLIKAAHSALRIGLLQKSRGLPAGGFGAAVKAMRILDDISISKIAAVRKPAQQDATVRILKANFNPSEARDEAGRWTDSGGLQVHQAAKAVGQALVATGIGYFGYSVARVARRSAALMGVGAALWWTASQFDKRLTKAAPSAAQVIAAARAQFQGSDDAWDAAERYLHDHPNLLTDSKALEAKAKELKIMEMDKLNTEVDDLIAKIDRVLDMPKKRKKVSADDERSAAADLEDDDEDEHIGKFSNTNHLNVRDESNRPGALATHDHSSWRGKVQTMVDNISATEGCDKTEALRRARARNPDLVHDMTKAAPTDFDSLVAAEIKKSGGYMSATVAGQRVMQAYGSAALDTRRITKGEDAEAALADAADTIWQQNDGLSRTESLRKARLSRPDLYRRMQRV